MEKERLSLIVRSLVIRLFLNHWLSGILVSLALVSAPVGTAYALGPAAASFPRKMTLRDEQLTARIVAAPLRQVMEEISRLSGARVRWMSLGGEEQEVSAEFTALPFSEALRRILGQKNFMLFYTSTKGEKTLAQIWLSSSGTGEEQPALKRQSASEMEAAQAAEEPDEDMAQLLDTVIQTAMSDEDLSLRLNAIEYLGHYVQEDPRIKAILSQLAHNDSSPQVQDIASAMLAGVE